MTLRKLETYSARAVSPALGRERMRRAMSVTRPMMPRLCHEVRNTSASAISRRQERRLVST